MNLFAADARNGKMLPKGQPADATARNMVNAILDDTRSYT